MSAYGMDLELGISFQNSFGTELTTSRDYLEILSESLNEDIPPIVSESLSGIYDEGADYEGFHAIGGDIVVEANPIQLGTLFKAWTGASSVSAQASCYTHTFIPQQADWGAMSAVPPMTIEAYRGDGGSSFIYYDCLANDLTLEFAHNAFVKATMSIIGGKFNRRAKTTATYAVGSLFTWDVTSMSVGGTAIDEFSAMTIKGSNALEAVGTMDGTKTPNRIKRSGKRTIEVSGTMLFVDQTEFNNYLAQTEQRLIINAQGATIGNSSVLMKIDIPKFKYTAYPVNGAGAGRLEVSFSGKAKYDTTSAYPMEITLQNTRTWAY